MITSTLPAPHLPFAAGESAARSHPLDEHRIRVQPGDCVVTARPVALMTVLGSCVSACIRDPVARVGGMNHFMLPEGEGVAGASARYGSHAMEVLVNEILKRGGLKSRLEAKVFGGGAVLRGFTVNLVGDRNAEFVRQYLAREGIPIVAEDLRGVHARKVYYYPLTGQAMVRRLQIESAVDPVTADREYLQRLAEGATEAGAVDLFTP